MKWLLWREYRLNRLILVAGVVLLLLPYLITLIVLLSPAAASSLQAIELFGIANIYSLILSQLTLALLGGNAIAGERVDRSAEFIAYLPLPRTRLLGGKLSLALSAAALIWGTNLLVLWIVVSLVPEWPRPLSPGITPLTVAYYIAITGFVFYGVSWLISSFQSSPTFAVGGGLIAPLLVIMGLSTVAWALGGPISDIWYTIICAVLAVVCFSTGTWYYLNRVEP